MKRLLLAAMLMLFACTPAIVPEGDNTTTQTNVTANGAETGDLVEVNYVLTLENGSVAATNNVELAQKHGLQNYVKGPFKFILGQSGIVPGFDTVIIGMKPGEHREAVIEPSEKKVVIPLNRTMIQDRLVQIPRYQKFPIKTYRTLYAKEPVIGDIVFNSTLQFKYQIVNKTDDAVLGKIVAKEGDEYQLKNTEWLSEVVRVAEEDMLLVQKPDQNKSFETPFGTAKAYTSRSKLFIRHDPELNRVFDRTVQLQGDFGVDQKFQITEIGEDYFVIERYGLLTDKRLQLSVDMLNLTKSVKQVKKSTPVPFVSVSGGTES